MKTSLAELDSQMAMSLTAQSAAEAGPSEAAPDLLWNEQNETAESLQVRRFSSWESAANLFPVWEEILAENDELSIFSTPEWLKPWWEAFGANGDLAILAFTDHSGRVVGLAPLYLETVDHGAFGQMELIRLIGDGSGDSDNLDLVVRPGAAEACVDAMLHWIQNQPHPIVCTLNTIDARSRSVRALAKQLSDADWVCQRTLTPCSDIPLTPDWDTYYGSLSAKFRQLLRRASKRLDRNPRMVLRRCNSKEDIRPMLEDLFRLHQKRWTRVGEAGSFISAARRSFYETVAAAFLQRGWLELWSLGLGGDAVAVQMNFRYRRTVYGLQEGFDPDRSQDHPGYALRASALKHFAESGAQRYSFLGGFTTVKARWGATRGDYANFSFAVVGTRAAYYLALNKAATAGKEWLRQRLPSSIWQVLRRIKLTCVGRTDTLALSSEPTDAQESIANQGT